MTNKALEELEKRFQRFRDSITEEQWQDRKFLSEKAEELEKSDPELGMRVLQRLHNLEPENETLRKRLNDFVSKLGRENAASLTATSADVQHSPAKPKVRQQVSDIVAQLSWFQILVVLPFVVFVAYQTLWASERYESVTQVIVKQPETMISAEPSLALLSGLTGSPADLDTEIVKAYIESYDMYAYLEQEMNITDHYQSGDWDVFSRLASDATIEDKHDYFNSRVTVDIDSKSSVISVAAQGFEPQFAHQLLTTLIHRAEWYINNIGNRLAKEQLTFVRQEHEIVEQRLTDVRKQVLAFQTQYNLLNPEAEGAALQQITYQIEAQLAQKKAHLNTLLQSMSPTAPLVVNTREQIQGLETQLERERNRMSTDGSTGEKDREQESINEVMARYSELKIRLELALQAFAASQISLEKSRIDAYKQIKFLVTVQHPYLPQESSYPRVIYNSVLLLVILLMVYGIGRIILATIKELRTY